MDGFVCRIEEGELVQDFDGIGQCLSFGPTGIEMEPYNISFKLVGDYKFLVYFLLNFRQSFDLVDVFSECDDTAFAANTTIRDSTYEQGRLELLNELFICIFCLVFC